MLKRPHYIALALVVMLTLAILNLPSQTRARLKSGLGGFFLPLFGLTSSSQRLVERASNTIVPRGELLRLNETLRQENEQLRLQLKEGEKALQENDKLRHLLAWQQRSRLKLKAARVILSEPANWSHLPGESHALTGCPVGRSELQSRRAGGESQRRYRDRRRFRSVG